MPSGTGTQSPPPARRRQAGAGGGARFHGHRADGAGPGARCARRGRWRKRRAGGRHRPRCRAGGGGGCRRSGGGRGAVTARLRARHAPPVTNRTTAATLLFERRVGRLESGARRQRRWRAPAVGACVLGCEGVSERGTAILLASSPESCGQGADGLAAGSRAGRRVGRCPAARRGRCCRQECSRKLALEGPSTPSNPGSRIAGRSAPETLCCTHLALQQFSQPQSSD